MSPLRALAACIFAPLVAFAAAGAFKAFTRTPPHEWPMTPTEKLAASGIEGRATLLNEEIARVSSGDEALRSKIVNVALYLRALDQDNEKLAQDAAESRGSVALVRSGSTWVRK